MIAYSAESFEAMRRLRHDEDARRHVTLPESVVEQGQLRGVPDLVVVADHLKRRRPVGEVVAVECAWTGKSQIDQHSC